MPRFDFKCEKCGADYPDMVLPRADSFPGYCRCSVGGKTTLVKQPSAPNFTISGYSEKNGYSK